MERSERDEERDDDARADAERDDDARADAERDDDGERDGDSGDEGGGGGSSLDDQALPPAPSVGPHTEIEREPPEERLARHDPSDVDAMGKDKRRSVVGGTYGPTRARIIATFSTAIGIIVVLVVGFYLLAKQLDKAPATNPDKAPWSVPDAPQRAPKPLQ